MFNKRVARISHHKYPKLFLCETCLCWNGEIFKKDNPNSQKNRCIKITCTCNKIKCTNCNNKRIMPGTSIWGLEDEGYYYVSVMQGLNPCEECGGKMTK